MSAIFSVAILLESLILTAPVLLAALGVSVNERAGVLNVSTEGLATFGSAVGFLVTLKTGSHLLGIVAAAAAGAAAGALLGYGAITLKAPQLILGLTLLVLFTGVSSLLFRAVVGIPILAPQIDVLTRGPIGIPWPVFYVLAGAGMIHLFLFKTRWGLRLRAVGENPRAADLQGINVSLVRYVSTSSGAALIAVAGALFPMLITGTYTGDIISGRGWIALMIVILGRWRPLNIVLGSWLFGFIDALRFRLTLRIDFIPQQFVLMLPFIIVILASIGVYRGATAPHALMKPYDRETRE